jgi:uncharacterized protein
MATDILAPGDQAALDRLKEVLRRDFGLVKLVLYGSKARGDSDTESDIDVLVVLGREVDWRTKRAIYDVCFDIGLKYDVLIQPVVFSEAAYESPRFRVTPLLQNVAAEGVEL